MRELEPFATGIQLADENLGEWPARFMSEANVGILLDTFVVRTIMVPAAVELLGDRIWWPSTPKGGGHALREHRDAEHVPVAEGGGA